LARQPKTRCIGILTAGGDCPGLNAAIRGLAKAAISNGIKVVGILDGFRGLVENRFSSLDDAAVSGILTRGGTILGTSRDKPHKMLMGARVMDMTGTAVENARRMGIDCLVCLGGGGTQKNALALQQAGLNVLTLPKTIHNDVAETDISFGYDTAMYIATEAIDRLHTTATSHSRLIVCEVMGHNAGWLALGAGLAGGADAVLIPEMPYDPEAVGEHLEERRRHGKRFSIIVVAEGALSRKEAAMLERRNAEAKEKPKKDKGKKKGELTVSLEPVPATGSDELPPVPLVQEPRASTLARTLQQMTGIEARVPSLGHVPRGGSPTPTDRLLCTRLGVRAVELLLSGTYNVMVAVKGDSYDAVPLERVAGFKKIVPPDHPLIETARRVGTCVGQ